MIELISGALIAGYAVVALFFFKFWRRSGDRLFAMFGGAFALLAVHRVVLALAADDSAAVTWIYALRLLAFLIILVAIIDKNRGAARTGAGRG